jgi:hypothetical protein
MMIQFNDGFQFPNRFQVRVRVQARRDAHTRNMKDKEKNKIEIIQIVVTIPPLSLFLLELQIPEHRATSILSSVLRNLFRCHRVLVIAGTDMPK